MSLKHQVFALILVITLASFSSLVSGQAQQPVCSTDDGGGELQLNITNNTSETLALKWIDFDCNEVFYAYIVAGQTYQQPTHSGHVWVAHNPDSEVVRQFIASSDETNIIIEEQSSAIERILFTSNRDGSGEIYSMNPDGSDLIRLTHNDVDDYWASYSPNGTRIVFFSNRDGSIDIYSMNADGSDIIRLTQGDTDDTRPAYSPDGTRIVFQSAIDGVSHLYSMNADGSDVIRLTQDSANGEWASYSPDGAHIVFVSSRDGVNQIYRMNADGSNVVRLTHDNMYSDVPSYSPDGTRIVFSSDSDGNPDLYSMNADGSDVIRLTNDPALEGRANYSLDGRRIVFHSDRNGNNEIYSMNADGSDVIRLTVDGTSNFDAAYGISAVSSEPETCSMSGTQEQINATFSNDTGGDVTLHWVDFECVETEGSLIPAGTEFPFTTYDGHEFIIRDAAGNLIGDYKAAVSDNNQVIPISLLPVAAA